MGLFGMSEAELKKFAQELEARELALKNKESDVSQLIANAKHERGLLDADKAAFAKERDEYLEEAKRIGDRIASANADLEKRRQEVVRLESEAKAGFSAKQGEAFKAVVEQRIKILDERETALDSRAASLAEDIAKVVAREGEVSKRELAVTEREQRADAGFADKVASLAEEARRQHEANLQEANSLKQREENLAKEKEELERKKESIRQRENAVADAERKRDAGYADERSALDSELNGKRVAWQNEDIQKRGALQKELADQKTTLLARLGEEVEAIRAQRFADIAASEKSERERIVAAANEDADRIRRQVEKERSDWEKEKSSRQEELKKANEASERKAGELSALRDKLEGKSRELDARERDLGARREALDTEVSELVEERKGSFDAHEVAMKEEISRLRDSLREQEELVGLFEQLKRQLGNRDAAEVLNDLEAKAAALKTLQEQLAQPNEVQQNRIDALQKELNEQKARAEQKEAELEERKAAVAEAAAVKRSRDEIALDNESLTRQLESVTAAANAAESELKRLRSAYERPSEVAARYREIEMPFITSDGFKKPSEAADVDEMQWLEGIREKCSEYGFYFPSRIIKAFHTSLKTSEWSPITVLAGVSGTGKSKLPELYSRFGGFVFDLLDVQPNWDSQESMLGFFNSIDNKFDAQSVLKLLAQSQIPAGEAYESLLERWHRMAGVDLKLDPEKDGKLIASLQNMNRPGLADCMSIVLLDEMNLAHPELYFAGFLSKLEERSGKHKSNIPALEVKIGAGLPAYKLPLGRNVLWVGTMNQDETTKSLSDKVLDRSTVIFFPRPRQLKSRGEVKSMKDDAKSPLINKGTFARWVSHSCDFIAERSGPYKAFVEEINDALGAVGRAVGHRVWQSIEYYMANYPDVLAAVEIKREEGEDGRKHRRVEVADGQALESAMHVAFEDQLVQKVMPKLRGIDTRGVGGKCLEKIREKLAAGVNGRAFNLDEDFKLAKELGYGQFMWQSANYLNAEEENANAGDPTEQTADPAPDTASPEEATSEEATSEVTGNADGGDELPPDWFRPGGIRREKMWARYSPEKRAELIQHHLEHEQQQ